MWFRDLLWFWTNHWKNRKAAKKSRKTTWPAGRWARSILTLEPLECRWAPATFTVNSLADELGPANGDGTGDTLRECLYSANTNNNSPAADDVILFANGLAGGTIVLDEKTDLYLAEDRCSSSSTAPVLATSWPAFPASGLILTACITSS